LQEKVVEQAAKLVEGTVDNSSLLSLVLGKKHLEYQNQPVAESEKDEPARSRDATKSGSEVQLQNTALAKVEELLQALVSRFDSVPVPEPIKKGRKRLNPGKRDTVIFATILAGFKGTRYCSFLDKYGIRPKWSDSGPATTSKATKSATPGERKSKMRRHALNCACRATPGPNWPLPSTPTCQRNLTRSALYSLNSRPASKTSPGLNPHND
jgi:hypothetical protein